MYNRKSLFFSHSIKEKDIEDFLFKYPYLISPEFSDGVMKRQYLLKLKNDEKRFIDLSFWKEREIIVIELKKTRINPSHVTQLSFYTHELKNQCKNKKIKGILIGTGIDKDTLSLIKNLNFRYYEFGKDIPKIIKFCDDCRRACSYLEKQCPWCGCSTFIE
ncbi:MAG: endonuclease NucS domain-containing protein [Promethearchaeota archaeon]